MRQWFRRPPRAHGEIDYAREVSFLELFYDLVYVVLIGQAAHHLAEHLDGEGAREFAVMFGLIWLAWFNGTVWHELHGREDGRSRGYIFIQMGLVALLAVYAANAGTSDGQPFAVVYLILFVHFTWQWHAVFRIDDPVYRPVTIRYLIGMVLTIVAIGVSIAVDDNARMIIWGAVVVAWVIGGLYLVHNNRTAGFSDGVTSSLVERFGLFTIIVLGEVVIGVVDGISEADQRDATTIAVGILSLMIGMGIWWNYFDLLGRRIPREEGQFLARWMIVHLPITMAIAASGAAMVKLVEHAHDNRTPTDTGRLLVGSVAVVLAGIAIASRSLKHDEFPQRVRRQVPIVTALGALAVVLIGLAKPSPLWLVIGINAVLSVVWLWLFIVLLASGGVPQRSGGPTETES